MTEGGRVDGGRGRDDGERQGRRGERQGRRGEAGTTGRRVAGKGAQEDDRQRHSCEGRNLNARGYL